MFSFQVGNLEVEGELQLMAAARLDLLVVVSIGLAAFGLARASS